MIPFLKTLSIILLVYYVLRFLIKLVSPYLIRFVTRKAQSKMQEMFKGFGDAAQNTKEEATVSKKSKKVVGEYIDFEEVE